MNHTEQTTNIHIPRLVVAAVQGRSGKTTFTIGLQRALRERGLLLQGFKKGPDYIDPSWSTFASGIPCRNLDAVMMTKEQILHSFINHAKDKDIAVVEGAMGIFDGLDWQGSNSTAELAVTLQAPVILVVNTTRITRSVAAIINGVVGFDKRVNIAGAVLNQVARPRHLNLMTKVIEEYCDVPLLGALPKSKNVEIPDRHLGLIPAAEQDALQARIDGLAKLVSDHVDLEVLLRIAEAAPALKDPLPERQQEVIKDKVRIGVFRDRAFSFYYPENLEALTREGAELIDIDALQETSLPALDGLYIGGGFPEIFAQHLADNVGMRQAVKEASEAGMPIYAECGGLMYLVRELVSENNHYPMAGIFDASVTMEQRPVGLGYTVQRATTENPFFAEGMKLVGHEFHHSRVEMAEPTSFGFATERGKGICEIDGQIMDGLVSRNTLATYHHFHAASSEVWAKNFVQLAEAFHKNK
ncbi:MAG: cobyrinate a,c-diamide synthase [Peptococcaceae bacterium]|nr:cobyrinate a,c-diamide synthase [Peptococcaceae bacterium]